MAIPMRVISIDGSMARCEAKGVERIVSLLLIRDEPIAPGDVVTVHLGYAREKIGEAEAQAIWDLYDEILESESERG
jgi:hydrogenase expression/formation protein HypC